MSAGMSRRPCSCVARSPSCSCSFNPVTAAGRPRPSDSELGERVLGSAFWEGCSAKARLATPRPDNPRARTSAAYSKPPLAGGGGDSGVGEKARWGSERKSQMCWGEMVG